MDASSFVLDTIVKGYDISFIDHLPSMYKGNNRSALSYAEDTWFMPHSSYILWVRLVWQQIRMERNGWF